MAQQSVWLVFNWGIRIRSVLFPPLLVHLLCVYLIWNNLTLRRKKQTKKQSNKTKNKYVFSAVGPCFISACPSCGIKFPERLSVRSDLSCLVPTVPGPCQVPHGAAAFRVRASAQPRDRTPDEPEHLQSISVCVQNILPLLLTVLTTGTVCSDTFKIVFYRLLHLWKIPCSYLTLLVLEVLFP